MGRPVEYIVPTWGMRLKFLASTAVIAAWWLSHGFWLPRLDTSIGADCAHNCAALPTLRFFAVYVSLMPLPWALWSGWTARRILSTGQMPPPGSWQLYRTRIYRGWRARAWAYGHGAAALAGFISTGLIAHWMGVAELFCITAPCGCP